MNIISIIKYQDIVEIYYDNIYLLIGRNSYILKHFIIDNDKNMITLKIWYNPPINDKKLLLDYISYKNL